MVKILVLCLAVFGAWMLMAKYLPQAWSEGLHVHGYFISGAVLIACLVAYLVYRMKSK